MLFVCLVELFCDDVFFVYYVDDVFDYVEWGDYDCEE